MSHANFSVLHYAVLNRAPDIVRILMTHGASAREGVYPHREATTPWATPRAWAEAMGHAEILRLL